MSRSGTVGISFGRAWCYRSDIRKTKWVGSKMGDGGADWGWTDNPSEAIELSLWWQRRYRADRRACGYKVDSPVSKATFAVSK
jgi:hypothetical protein